MERQYRLREAGLEWRLVEGEIVALDVESSEYLAVNKSGAAIWEQLVTGASKRDMVSSLQSNYSLDADAADQDVSAFLEQLSARGLLEA